MRAGNVVAVALDMEITVVRSGKTPDYTAAHQRAVEGSTWCTRQISHGSGRTPEPSVCQA